MSLNSAGSSFRLSIGGKEVGYGCVPDNNPKKAFRDAIEQFMASKDFESFTYELYNQIEMKIEFLVNTAMPK